MELKLAKKELGEKKSEKLSDEAVLKNAAAQIYYFDKENAAKDVNKFKSALEKKGRRVFLNEVRYTTDESDFIYEMHIL